MANPLPLPFPCLLQVTNEGIKVRACAANYLMLHGRRRVGPRKLLDLDSYDLLVQL
jgi:hypothetical protein